MLGLLDHSPDMFLDEIQDQLFHQHGIDISLATISRTLKRLGISSKKVCNCASQAAYSLYNHTLSFPKLLPSVARKPGVNFTGKLAKSLQSTLSLQTKVPSTFSRWSSGSWTPRGARGPSGSLPSIEVLVRSQ